MKILKKKRPTVLLVVVARAAAEGGAGEAEREVKKSADAVVVLSDSSFGLSQRSTSATKAGVRKSKYLDIYFNERHFILFLAEFN